MARILVPVKEDAAGEHALSVACRAAGDAGDEVYAVYVVRVPPQLPISADLPAERARAERVFERAQALADRHNACLTAVIVEARSEGPAIVEAAQGCDYIMMGRESGARGLRRRLFGRFLLNRTLRYVLRHAPCPVLIGYAPPVGHRSTEARHFLLSDVPAVTSGDTPAGQLPANVYQLQERYSAVGGSRRR